MPDEDDMDTPTGDHNVAARIITAELLATLRRDRPAADGAPAPSWVRAVREWPGRVVPETPEQIHAAALTLISRARWPQTHVRDLVHALTPLYQAGWCNTAIVHALDHEPDGTRAMPWHDGEGKDAPRGELLAFLDKRLHRWRIAGLHTPPVLGTPFGAWAARMHELRGDDVRDHVPRPEASTTPTEHLPDRRRRGTPLGRVRARNTRQDNLDADLRKLGGHLPGEDTPAPVDPGLVLLAAPDVHRALVDLARATRPHRHHVDALRRAVRRAHLENTAATLTSSVDHDHLARLAAEVTRADGTPVPLGALAQLIDKAW
ncbi:hypothetical protein [Actinosynnema sp. NPDC023587]|uniref:hypothetical protein n=1 Tax=Actinosynnema sp. NPDC023587 TaxID=3154695 RepID=UPI0033D0E1F0